MMIEPYSTLRRISSGTTASSQLGLQRAPVCDLALAAGDVLVERDVEPVDQVWLGPRLMNQGTYSLKCSLDSVTK